MKKKLLTASMVLVLAGCGSDIDIVKDGIMDFDRTTTIGKALDNWESCETKAWEELQKKNGTKIVQFTCQHRITHYLSNVKRLLPPEDQANANHLDIISYTHTFQFTINLDDTFQLDRLFAKHTWADDINLESPEFRKKVWKSAYSNILIFDPVDLDEEDAALQSASWKLFRTIAEGQR